MRWQAGSTMRLAPRIACRTPTRRVNTNLPRSSFRRQSRTRTGTEVTWRHHRDPDRQARPQARPAEASTSASTTHASVSASGAQPSSSPATTAVPQRRRHRPAPLSPLQDYQSDDALNAPAPTSPATPLRSPRQPVSPSPWAQRTGFARRFPRCRRQGRRRAHPRSPPACSPCPVSSTSRASRGPSARSR
jgi:hypothetical protein